MSNFFYNKNVNRVCFFVFSSFFLQAEDLFVDFIQGTAPNKNFKEMFLQQEGLWADAKALYDKQVLNGQKTDHARIPFILHHIWLGSELPQTCAQLRKSWIDRNPYWLFILWTDNELNFALGKVVNTFEDLHECLQQKKEQFIVFDIRDIILTNQEAYDVTRNYGEKSDILRYEVLYEFGGLYVDTDFECLKPFDIFHHYCDFYTGISYSANFSFLNGLIGSAPKSDILKYCIEDLKSNDGKEAFLEIIYRTGPRHLTRSFFKALGKGYTGVAVGFPSTTFYPWPNWLRHEKNIDKIKSWTRPESFAIHYWHTTWWLKYRHFLDLL
ncbi:MAG: glycosyltransferase [Candidatus Dependentiae bacterium]